MAEALWIVNPQFSSYAFVIFVPKPLFSRDSAAAAFDLCLCKTAESDYLLKVDERKITMKAFVAALICVVVIAVGGAYVLNTQQRTVSEAFSTDGARVGNPGHNLIGTDARL
ncbi:MAG: hypothetical protein ABI407_02620 [Bradyrhizobium sp.]